MAWSNCFGFVVVMCCAEQMLSYVDHQKIYVQGNMTEIYLNCSTQAAVAWLREEEILTQPGMKITTDPRFQMIIDTYVKQLRIKDIKSNYSGVYTCAEYRDGNILNTSIVTYDVIVVEHLTVQKPITNVSVLEGSNAILVCNVKGRPEPEIKWYIVKDPLIDIGITGKMLQIMNFSRDCAVQYMCIAKHINAGNVNITFTPIPEFPPEVWITGKDLNTTNNSIQITGSLNSPFELKCFVAANPFVNITVTQNNQRLVSICKDNPKKTISNEKNEFIYDYEFMPTDSVADEPYTYGIRIKGHLKESMFGKYECVSHNAFGRDGKIIIVNKADD